MNPKLSKNLWSSIVSGIRQNVEVPQWLSDIISLPLEEVLKKEDVVSIEIERFDQTYIEFLDSQIKLMPRGPQWNEILVRRRDGLKQFSNTDILLCTIRGPSGVNCDTRLTWPDQAFIFCEIV